MRLDYSKLASYLACPKKYKFREDRVTPAIPSNDYYSASGEFVQKFFEYYSNSWKAQGISTDRERIKNRMRPYWEELLRKRTIDWSAPMSKLGEYDLFLECIDIIIKNLKELDVYDNTRSEFKWLVTLKSGDEIVSKPDFVKMLPEGAKIIDGKNSNTIGKYTDPRQLLFYGVVYRLLYKKPPVALSFLYYKHVVEVPLSFTVLELDEMWETMVKTIISIKATKEFLPNPCAKNCGKCDYLGNCPEGQADMASRKRGPRKPKKVDMEGLIPDENGVYSIGF